LQIPMNIMFHVGLKFNHNLLGELDSPPQCCQRRHGDVGAVVPHVDVLPESCACLRQWPACPFHLSATLNKPQFEIVMSAL
jgi:hypothetical protein